MSKIVERARERVVKALESMPPSAREPFLNGTNDIADLNQLADYAEKLEGAVREVYSLFPPERVRLVRKETSMFMARALEEGERDADT